MSSPSDPYEDGLREAILDALVPAGCSRTSDFADAVEREVRAWLAERVLSAAEIEAAARYYLSLDEFYEWETAPEDVREQCREFVTPLLLAARSVTQPEEGAPSLPVPAEETNK